MGYVSIEDNEVNDIDNGETAFSVTASDLLDHLFLPAVHVFSKLSSYPPARRKTLQGSKGAHGT
jgi:hypothetical protein